MMWYIQSNFACSNSDDSNTMDHSNWFFKSPVSFAVNSLSNKHQFLEQSNYFHGPVIINQYKLPFQT